ncbi:MAG: enoyl-CoA hydratase/isomerase family protein [bacterium]|nr:enoyl-CoA hydratase/isomerase family protein [Gammaproteobacteria bacterium]HIL96160.1 enoyl-CoA hydratase/isomerase family protein [Pseudomonadales bacterium]
MSDEVLFETFGLKNGQTAGVVTLNIEKTLNSLSLKMVELMAPQLANWEKDDDIVFVLFQGAGDRAFCAGGDVQALYHDMVEHKGGPCPYCDAFFEQEYRLDYQIRTYKKPTLVWGHGIVMGGGLGILSACSHRIGTERTRIAMPEITIGLIPDAGATWSFSRMEEHWAYFLAWTGSSINGRDAKQVGLIDFLVNHQYKRDFIDQLGQQDWSGDPEAVLSHLIANFESRSSDFPDGQLERHEELIRDVVVAALTSENPVANFRDSLDRLTGDNWLEKAAATFDGGAPTTAHIIVEQFRRAKSMTMKETFQLELTLAVQCSRHPDFAEGVRALLIEKDNRPSWYHGVMGEVPNEWVEEHFYEPWTQHPMQDLAE